MLTILAEWTISWPHLQFSWTSELPFAAKSFPKLMGQWKMLQYLFPQRRWILGMNPWKKDQKSHPTTPLVYPYLHSIHHLPQKQRKKMAWTGSNIRIHDHNKVEIEIKSRLRSRTDRSEFETQEIAPPNSPRPITLFILLAILQQSRKYWFRHMMSHTRWQLKYYSDSCVKV